MKLKHYLGLVALLAIFVGFTTRTAESEPPSARKKEILVKLIQQTINSYHVNPRDINDDFSKAVFKEYLKTLDYSKRFLIAEDIKKLSDYETLIDDEIGRGTYRFFDLSLSLVDQRIKEAEGYYVSILKKPFDFSVKESIETDPEKLTYAANQKELKDQWRKTLKYQTLGKLYGLIEKKEKAIADGNDTLEIVSKSFDQLEVEAREKVKKSYDDWFKRRNRMDENDQLSMYINAITMVFDPHTNFYPPKEKENFDISISGRLEGIGATLMEKDGFIKVTKIVPGSASWRQGDLKADDMILMVAQGDEEPVDIVDMRLDDAVNLIRGKKGTEVRLTVKKIDGTQKVIPIIRDVVLLEETYAKSAIIVPSEDSATATGANKIGYINLPKFYTSFGGEEDGRSCFEDVQKEVLKLKQENVSGIVIDLRDNGGGSLQDVRDMAGLFIDKGPVVQVKDRMRTEVLKDPNSGIIYNGPLVIMINEFSASASEILAAAMQDYDRAIIVGTGTYGKGTVQRILTLDQMLGKEYADIFPLGALKLTIQKFYRINGGSTQHKGVMPDINLPSEYQFLDYGEKDMEFSLPWDEIPAAVYEKTNSIKNKTALIANSQKRVKSDSTFILINEKAELRRNRKDSTIYPLNLEEYKAMVKEREAINEDFDDMFNPIKEMSVLPLISEKMEMESDTTFSNRTKEFQKTIKKDKYIYEVMSIMNEMK